jgi:hypothetical protein
VDIEKYLRKAASLRMDDASLQLASSCAQGMSEQDSNETQELKHERRSEEALGRISTTSLLRRGGKLKFAWQSSAEE